MPAFGTVSWRPADLPARLDGSDLFDFVCSCYCNPDCVLFSEMPLPLAEHRNLHLLNLHQILIGKLGRQSMQIRFQSCFIDVVFIQQGGTKLAKRMGFMDQVPDAGTYVRGYLLF